MSESDLARLLSESFFEHMGWFLVLFLGLALAFFGIGARVWGRQTASQQEQEGETSRIASLFWQLDCYVEGQSQEPRKVYLRSLTPHKATMLTSDSGLQKGMTIKLDLSPILERPALDVPQFVGARILRHKNLGGSPENYLINVQFISGRSWAPSAIQRSMNASIHRLHGKSQQQQPQVL